MSEYEEQNKNLLVLIELMSKEKDLMPQENFDLILSQDYAILQTERWIEDNKKIITNWDCAEENLKKH